ncbi:hypothetical protein AVEN_10073-1 [Araneus ventricosus]|uniref:Uncharacterized protein n=1 Tax=Araneus ventricosus TaxID=182803 RepID=A0A4Y2VAI6_ARAVE|nr:hypothetical protein AVEN_10073-1 [Araneus ventricosus]
MATGQKFTNTVNDMSRSEERTGNKGKRMFFPIDEFQKPWPLRSLANTVNDMSRRSRTGTREQEKAAEQVARGTSLLLCRSNSQALILRLRSLPIQSTDYGQDREQWARGMSLSDEL